MKKVLIILLVIVAVGTGVGIYLWNKPHETVEGKDAIAVRSDALAQVFSDDEQQGNAQYLNKVLDVSGTVAEVSQNQDGKTVILLNGADLLSGVQCTMREDKVQATVGQQMTIKGFCNGYTVVVLLSDCIVTSPK